MLPLRETPAGEEYYEVSNERGAVLATKNHQGGLDDPDDESNGKIFERSGSKWFPVKLISKYLSHLNTESSNLFQRPASPCKSFNPAKDEEWFCSVPLGHNSLENMLRAMTSRAGIQPYLTKTLNQYLRIKLHFFFEYPVRSKKHVIKKLSNFSSSSLHFTSFSLN